MAEFTTSEGKLLVIRPVAQRKVSLLFASRETPRKPIYTVQSAGGADIVLEHNETTLETEEDKNAWEVYLEAVAEEASDFTERWVSLILTDGVIMDMPKSDEWKRRQAYQGIDVPEGEFDQWLHYLLTEVLRGENEVKRLIDSIMALNNDELRKRQEAVNAVVDSFRPEIQG